MKAKTYIVFVLGGKSASNGTDDDGKVDANICQHNGRMPPLVGQQLWKSKGSQLSVTSALEESVDVLQWGEMTYKTDQGTSGDERCIVLCRPPDDESDEEEGVAANNEPSTAEEIRVGTADPAKMS